MATESDKDDGVVITLAPNLETPQTSVELAGQASTSSNSESASGRSNPNVVARAGSYSVGKFLNPEQYDLIRPENLHEDDAQHIERLAIKGSTLKVETRLRRELTLFLIPFILVFLNEIFRDDGNDATDLSFTFGVATLMMTLSYFGHFFVILTGCCAHRKNRMQNEMASQMDPNISTELNKGITGTGVQHLYRVYSLNYDDPYWAGMNFTFGAIYFKYHPITSISELSAIMGGTANSMLVITSSYTFGILCCAIAAQQWESSDDERYWSIDTGLVMAGCFGLTFVGSFELDQLSKAMVRFHYLGAAMCLLAWIALLLQSIKLWIATDGEYMFGLILSCVFFVIIIIGFTLWDYFQRKSEQFADNENDIRTNMSDQDAAKIVTSLTIKCIASEAAFLSVPAFSVAVWLMQSGLCHIHDCYSVFIK